MGRIFLQYIHLCIFPPAARALACGARRNEAWGAEQADKHLMQGHHVLLCTVSGDRALIFDFWRRRQFRGTTAHQCMYFRVFLCLDCFIVILLGGTGPVADLGASLIDEVVLRKQILFLARSEAGEDMPSGELIKQCVCVCVQEKDKSNTRRTTCPGQCVRACICSNR